MATVNYSLTTRMASLTDYAGVVTGALANNTARAANRLAIQTAIGDCVTNNKILVVPPGTYEIHGAGLVIGSGFRWLGTMESRLVQHSLNLPVMHVGPALGAVGETVENTVIDGVYLRYAGTATIGGNALELNGAYMCTFKNFQIGDVQAPFASRTSVPYIGVYCDDAAGTTPCFSCTWETIRIKHFVYRGFSADRLNYEAATGNSWTNIYIAGGNSSGVQDISTLDGACAMILGSQAQASFRVFNVEWMKARQFVDMGVCNQTTFETVNFEGLHLKSPTGGATYGFFHMYNGSYTFKGVTIADCHVLGADNMAAGYAFWVGPDVVASVDNLRIRASDNSVGFYIIGSHSATNSRVDLGQVVLGDSDNMSGYDSSFASGTGCAYGLLSDFNGAGVRTLADANATLYSYRGDSSVRIPATGTRTIVLARQCTAGIFAVIPPGVRKRIRNTGAGSLAIQNYNTVSLGSIASGAAADYVFDGSDWLLA